MGSVFVLTRAPSSLRRVKLLRLALALLVGLVPSIAGTGVALGACCELAYLEVRSGEEVAVRIEAAELEQTLSAPDFQLLYWPAANGSMKSTERPPGDLGTAYEVVYVLRDAAGRPTVEVRETVYPDASGGPVAVAASGQTMAFRPGKPSPVPAGWRPFPEQAAQELEAIVESARQGPGWTSSSVMWLALVAAVGVLAAGWFVIRRRATPSASTDGAAVIPAEPVRPAS